MDTCTVVFLDREKTEPLPIGNKPANYPLDERRVWKGAFTGKYPELPGFSGFWLTGTKDADNTFTLSVWSGDPDHSREAILSVYYSEKTSTSSRLWETMSQEYLFRTGNHSCHNNAPDAPWMGILNGTTDATDERYQAVSEYLMTVLPWAVVK